MTYQLHDAHPQEHHPLWQNTPLCLPFLPGIYISIQSPLFPSIRRHSLLAFLFVLLNFQLHVTICSSKIGHVTQNMRKDLFIVQTFAGDTHNPQVELKPLHIDANYEHPVLTDTLDIYLQMLQLSIYETVPFAYKRNVSVYCSLRTRNNPFL